MSLTKERRENAARLYKRLAEAGPSEDWIKDADELQRISRALGRIAERQCNEDTGCPKCGGQGEVAPGQFGAPMTKCRACGGTGDTLGPRESRLLLKANLIANRYGFRVYHQSDPRGWQVYLMPLDTPQAEDDSHYSQRGIGVAS